MSPKKQLYNKIQTFYKMMNMEKKDFILKIQNVYKELCKYKVSLTFLICGTNF